MTIKNIKKFLLIIFIILGTISCKTYEQDPSKVIHEGGFSVMYDIPTEAKILKNLGNGWIIFECDGRKILFHHNNFFESMTELSDRGYHVK